MGESRLLVEELLALILQRVQLEDSAARVERGKAVTGRAWSEVRPSHRERVEPGEAVTGRCCSAESGEKPRGRGLDPLKRRTVGQGGKRSLRTFLEPNTRKNKTSDCWRQWI